MRWDPEIDSSAGGGDDWPRRCYNVGMTRSLVSMASASRSSRLGPVRVRSRFGALFGAVATLGVLSLLSAGCSKEYVRGSDDPSVDHEAMSTGLDKRDIQKRLQECLGDLRNQPILAQWRTAGKASPVAVFPFQNDTDEHIDSALAAVLGEAEDWLIEGGTAVIDRQRQNQLIAETEGTQHPVFNKESIPRYGRQLGVKYYLTGNVQGASERTEDARRVQYFLFLRVVEVETGLIVWQHKAHVTKMVR
jgi:penicillin-binding protein activator